MDENKFTQQLNTEIEKLKENDYTSYQSFYNQTANYLYGIIWNNVKDQSIADSLLNELYTEIYSSIATELTDNSQFYTWAENKAQTLTTTYLSTHELSGIEKSDNDRRAEGVAVAAAMNSGMDMSGGAFSSGMADGTFGATDMGLGSAAGGVADAGIGSVTGGSASVGMGSATGGAANIGMNSGTYGSGQAGISMSSSAPAQSGIGTMANGIGQSGVGTAPNGPAQSGIGTVANGIGQSGVGTTAETMGVGSATGAGSTAGAGLASGAAHVGLSLGAKLAIGLASAALVVGGGIGVHALVNSNNDKKTEETTEITTEVAASVTDADETTEITEEIIENTTEEEQIDEEKVARYTAYYEVVKSYMELYPTEVSYTINGYGAIEGLRFVELIDFNGDGNEHLVISYRDNSDYRNNIFVDIYDYADGNAIQVASVDCGRTDGSYGSCGLYLTKLEDNRQILWVMEDKMNRAAPAQAFFTRFEYVEGNVLDIHVYSDNNSDYFTIDGVEVEKEVYEYEQEKMWSETKDAQAFTYLYDDLSFYSYTPVHNDMSLTLIEKHRTIKLLANISGDHSFDNEDETIYISNDGSLYSISGPNRYNETYSINLTYALEQGEAEISADGRSFHFVENKEVNNPYVSNPQFVDADFYMSYYEDVLIVVGEKEIVSYEENGEMKTRIQWLWLVPDGYEVIEQDDNSMAEAEYNARGNELMTR